MPSFATILSSLRYDSSPLGSVLYFRFWTLFGSSDEVFRLGGLLVGLGITRALWWNARILRLGAPLLSLALFAFNPVAVFYGDSIGPYGLGILFTLLLFGCLARLLESTSAANIIVAMVSAVLCVQCLYQTSVLVAAFCLAGTLTALLRRRRGSAVWILGAGAVAALTLLPDLSAIRYSIDWRVVQRPIQAVGWRDLWPRRREAMGAQGHFEIWIWLGLCATGIVASAALSLFAACRRLRRGI